MRIKSSVMLGILLSFMTLCAVRADSIVTSKSYVDAQDALKQNKIPAGTTGNVVTYNGESNGQAQFDELAVFPASGTYNAGTDADKLATMGAVMASMASSGSQPALSGTNGAIVTYGNAPGVTGERKILSGWYEPFVPGGTAGNGDHLVDAQSVMGVVYTIGNRPISVMECADGENVSDENCMLWHISQRHVLSWPTGYSHSSYPFINSSEFPSYEPYNP